mmetsp:Transcript_2547/g.9781  ORF Transcript_2547/g.9781 Transcript_2547/m.9781 type:complete len:203 (-) Transcript_2547:372-980(-)
MRFSRKSLRRAMSTAPKSPSNETTSTTPRPPDSLHASGARPVSGSPMSSTAGRLSRNAPGRSVSAWRTTRSRSPRSSPMGDRTPFETSSSYSARSTVRSSYRHSSDVSSSAPPSRAVRTRLLRCASSAAEVGSAAFWDGVVAVLAAAASVAAAVPRSVLLSRSRLARRFQSHAIASGRALSAATHWFLPIAFASLMIGAGGR